MRETEWSLSWRMWRARRLPRLFGSLSKVSSTSSRSDMLLDRAILQEIVKKMRRGGLFALTAQPHRPVVQRGTNTKGARKRISTRQRGYLKDSSREAKRHITPGTDPSGKQVTRIYLPNWDHVSDVIKAVCYGEAMDKGTRHAFTLRLTQEVREAALRSSRGFVPYMQSEIARHLKRALPAYHPIQFVIVLEAAYFQQAIVSEPFHLHGAIEIPPEPDRLILGSIRDSVEEALWAAGGRLPPKRKARQLLIKRMYRPLGWFAYLSKFRLVTLEALGVARKQLGVPDHSHQEKVVAATTGVRRAGKAWFSAARTMERVFRAKPMRKRRKRASKRTAATSPR